ncbi:PREDICTED: uncharacterized protein LOC106821599 [Priapulus caudatus]|uniref:Uncharacterized protein LOC106821599 n=1 Tax=Priapulus caudatus TaxID=37621 RepID=A0ABM1FBZ7_PRICU|nr:PREDICTED: uncharacterized protein LOC106821599 [Priapulus caudatus]
MLPDAVLVTHMPMLTSGKLDRQTLRSWHTQRKVSRDNDNDAQSCDDLSLDEQRVAATVLSTAEQLLALPPGALHLNDDFFRVGGDSVTGVLFVQRLADAAISLSIPEFVSAATLKQVVRAVRPAGADVALSDAHADYRVMPMSERNEPTALLHIGAAGFLSKGAMESQLEGLTTELHSAVLKSHWDDIVNFKETFVVVDGDNRVIAGAINCSMADEPAWIYPPVMAPLVAVLERAERDVIRDIERKGIPPGKVLRSVYMASDVSLTSQENLRLMNMMVEEIYRKAKLGKYECIVTVNTSRVMQEIYKRNGYEAGQTFLEYCTFEFMGRRPFSLLPAGEGAESAIKYL